MASRTRSDFGQVHPTDMPSVFDCVMCKEGHLKLTRDSTLELERSELGKSRKSRKSQVMKKSGLPSGWMLIVVRVVKQRRCGSW